MSCLDLFRFVATLVRDIRRACGEVQEFWVLSLESRCRECYESLDLLEEKLKELIRMGCIADVPDFFEEIKRTKKDARLLTHAYVLER